MGTTDRIEQARAALKVISRTAAGGIDVPETYARIDALCDLALKGQQVEALEKKLMELRRYRCEQDCCYTMGDVADISGKHCPFDRPCERCKTEAMREELEAWRKESQGRVADAIIKSQEREAMREVIRREHDKIGSMIDQVGHPDYSLREMVDGLRDVRDELLRAALEQALNERKET